MPHRNPRCVASRQRYGARRCSTTSSGKDWVLGDSGADTGDGSRDAACTGGREGGGGSDGSGYLGGGPASKYGR